MSSNSDNDASYNDFQSISFIPQSSLQFPDNLEGENNIEVNVLGENNIEGIEAYNPYYVWIPRNSSLADLPEI